MPGGFVNRSRIQVNQDHSFLKFESKFVSPIKVGDKSLIIHKSAYHLFSLLISKRGFSSLQTRKTFGEIVSGNYRFLIPVIRVTADNCAYLQSVSWILAEFYFNRGLQRLYTGTCIIPQKTINGFLCLLIVFLKSKTYQLILKDVIKLNRNLP